MVLSALDISIHFAMDKMLSLWEIIPNMNFIVIKSFIFFIFFWKELIICHKLWFSNPYIFETQWCFKLMLFDLTEVISKVYDIGIQRYWDEKIRVCCKDSISLLKVLWTQNKMRHFTLGMRKIASEKGQQFCRTYNLKTLIKLKQFFRFTKIQYFIKALT